MYPYFFHFARVDIREFHELSSRGQRVVHTTNQYLVGEP